MRTEHPATAMDLSFVRGPMVAHESDGYGGPERSSYLPRTRPVPMRGSAPPLDQERVPRSVPSTPADEDHVEIAHPGLSVPRLVPVRFDPPAPLAQSAFKSLTKTGGIPPDPPHSPSEGHSANAGDRSLVRVQDAVFSLILVPSVEPMRWAHPVVQNRSLLQPRDRGLSLDLTRPSHELVSLVGPTQGDRPPTDQGEELLHRSGEARTGPRARTPSASTDSWHGSSQRAPSFSASAWMVRTCARSRLGDKKMARNRKAVLREVRTVSLTGGTSRHVAGHS
jgi:hypothetical protein